MVRSFANGKRLAAPEPLMPWRAGICARLHRNSIGKSVLVRKGVIKIRISAGYRSHLYFFLIHRKQDSHRFFISHPLFESALHRYVKVALMLDLILLALILSLFVLSIGYAYACDRL